MHLGDRLKLAMDYLDVTAYKIGKDTPVSRELIGKYLTGNTDPSSTNLAIITDYLNLNTDWLLKGEGEMWKQKPQDENSTTIVSEPKVSYDKYTEKYINKLEEDNKYFLKLVEDLRIIIKEKQEIIDGFISGKIIIPVDKGK